MDILGDFNFQNLKPRSMCDLLVRWIEILVPKLKN